MTSKGGSWFWLGQGKDSALSFRDVLLEINPLKFSADVANQVRRKSFFWKYFSPCIYHECRCWSRRAQTRQKDLGWECVWIFYSFVQGLASLGANGLLPC